MSPRNPPHILLQLQSHCQAPCGPALSGWEVRGRPHSHCQGNHLLVGTDQRTWRTPGPERGRELLGSHREGRSCLYPEHLVSGHRTLHPCRVAFFTQQSCCRHVRYPTSPRAGPTPHLCPPHIPPFKSRHFHHQPRSVFRPGCRLPTDLCSCPPTGRQHGLWEACQVSDEHACDWPWSQVPLPGAAGQASWGHSRS